MVILYIVDTPPLNPSDVISIFSQYGTVLEFHLTPARYGFVRYEFTESAKSAYGIVSNLVILGSSFRLIFARSSLGGSPPSLHVRFHGFADFTVDENLLFNTYSPVGYVTGACIKDSVVNSKRIQKGYGFIYFEDSFQGIAAAIYCAEKFPVSVLMNMEFKCEMSKILTRIIISPARSEQNLGTK